MARASKLRDLQYSDIANTGWRILQEEPASPADTLGILARNALPGSQTPIGSVKEITLAGRFRVVALCNSDKPNSVFVAVPKEGGGYVALELGRPLEPDSV